ncbi:MAG TPA: signal recognition particle-docking protein FtsY [Fibrobacteres bacterium]|jgi:fused signal recognition particle receptor|nr:signal recognition particle-docking protein FtsY [Fibrobacterota bacterium]
MNFFSRLKDGLSKTRTQISGIVNSSRKFTDDFYDSLEDALISADVGLDFTTATIERLKAEIKTNGITDTGGAYELLKKMLAQSLDSVKPVEPSSVKPHVILIVGVNGVGKTTTIGKLANEYHQHGKKVILGAADTFRAGAIEQLKIWADKTGSDFISQHEGADAASVAFDAMEAAKARNSDVLILDTAGRLHNKVNLMNELEKIVRVIRRNTPHAPDEILLVIDATTGQNALKQARVFHDSIGLTGFVITKLDGTAKGGIALALKENFNLPIRKIGVGEGMTDLQNFDSGAYIEAMFGTMAER